MNYSVLMSVYRGEKAEYLRESMLSIFSQSVKTNDFVLVCDGPVTEAINKVIEELSAQFGDVLNVVRLKENRGLGHALNAGLKHCKNELIARMDSDDISCLDRCERQLKVFEERSEIAVCSGVVEEFSESISNTTVRRVPPETQEEIIKFARKRNPFNHPCVMYRKSAVEAAGGYQDFYLLEDYFLWVRLLLNGCTGYNLQETLLHMRAGEGLYLRRSGWKYAISQKKLFDYMRQSGFITTPQYLKSVCIRSASSLMPNQVRVVLFKTLLRK